MHECINVLTENAAFAKQVQMAEGMRKAGLWDN